MYRANAIVDKTVQDLMAGVFREHLSTDHMTLDTEAAEQAAEKLRYEAEEALGLDESYIVVASAVTLYHTLRDELPGNYVLPQRKGFMICRN
jgi:hypothetical protein